MKSNPRFIDSVSSDRPEDGSATFTLSSLVAKAAAAKEGAPKPRSAPTSDDSGLIDLKALEAAAQAAEANPATLISPVHVGVFPFGSPELAAPPAEVAKVDDTAVRKEKKIGKGRWIAGTLGAVLVSAVAIGVASAGPKVELVTLGARLSPAFEVAAKRASAVQTTPQEVASPEVKPATGAERAPRAPVANSRGERKSEPKQNDVKKTPPPPPPEACDLMCQMRRATGQKK